MALEAYMKVTGSVQGDISGKASNSDSIGQQAKTDSATFDLITVVGFKQGVILPTDPSAGVVTGSRSYQPVVVTKFVDKATPLLWGAIAKNEVLTQVVLDFYRPHPTGAAPKQKFFTITWDNVTLVAASTYSELILDPVKKTYPMLEDWQFTFLKVKWEHVVASTNGDDSW